LEHVARVDRILSFFQHGDIAPDTGAPPCSRGGAQKTGKTTTLPISLLSGNVTWKLLAILPSELRGASSSSINLLGLDTIELMSFIF
jgi:hypothetical protein